ncbi:AI-2E family transporter [Aquipuribacter sp. MA13-6]|uniref:AI-2E family transporter n=1 Tax=unclassified Aquipuribacter TaxID=2635084 RepID=UPI003EEBDA23
MPPPPDAAEPVAEHPVGPAGPPVRHPDARRDRRVPPPPVQVPRALEIATAWAWRLLVVSAAVYLFAFLVLGRVQLVAVPLLLAVLVAALLSPLYRGLLRARVPRYPAAGVSVVVFVTLVVAAITVVSQQIASQIGDFGTSASEGLDQILAFVADLLGVSLNDVRDAITGAAAGFVEQSESLATGAVVATGTATSVLTGALLTVFAVFFYLADGERIWTFLVGLLPRDGRPRADVAGRRSWGTLSGYVRALPVVALVDALGIGIGAAVLGVPFALPIAVITFIGAFVPLVGAIVTGALAVLVALVSEGLVTALILLAVVFAVQQLESYVLQPLLLGRAVELYPLAVVAAITTGIVLAGIVGGILAVPLLAMVVTFVRSLAAPHHVPYDDPDDSVPPDDPGEPRVPGRAPGEDVRPSAPVEQYE